MANNINYYYNQNQSDNTIKQPTTDNITISKTEYEALVRDNEKYMVEINNLKYEIYNLKNTIESIMRNW